MSACSTWLLRDIDYYGHVLPVQCTKCVNSFVVRFARKFLWKFPILQLLCSQARRRLQEELTQKPSECCSIKSVLRENLRKSLLANLATELSTHSVEGVVEPIHNALFA